MNIEKLIKSKVREIPDWPRKGVSFKDITPLLEKGEIVGIEFLIELANLAGRKRLKDHKVTSLAKFH